MAKTLIDAARGESLFLVDPTKVRVIGVDTTHKKGEHPLWQQRAFRGPKEASVLSMKRHGNRYVPPLALELAEDGGWDLADGRGRVIDAREANRRLAEEGLPPFQLKALVKRAEDEITSIERMSVPNNFGTTMTLMDRIRDAQALVERGTDMERICTNMGVGEAQIERWMVVANASQAIRDALESDAISFKVALAIAMKPPAAQKNALELALGGGRKLTSRQVERAQGKAHPPTRKALRNVLAGVKKRRDALASQGLNDATIDLATDLLEYVYVGGVLPAQLRDALEPKAPAKKVVASVKAEAPHVWDATDEAILTHGLTERATKVVDLSACEDGDEAVTTIAGRMEAAGYCVADDELSARLVRLSKAGKCERAIGGYRRNKVQG